MLVTKILERVEAYIPEIQIQDLQQALNDIINIIGLTCNRIDTYFDALGYLEGTHDGGTAADKMTASLEIFPLNNSLVGMTLKNTTDGSEGTIESNSLTAITVDELTGGTDNQWENGDTFEIETRKISLPLSMISCKEVYMEVNGEVIYVPQTLSMEEYEEEYYSDNYQCLIKDRIIYFPALVTPDSTLKLISNLPYTECTAILSNTTEVDLPDKYLQLIKNYIIKEVCVMPEYKEQFGYLYNKFQEDYKDSQRQLRSNKNLSKFSIGTTF